MGKDSKQTSQEKETGWLRTANKQAAKKKTDGQGQPTSKPSCGRPCSVQRQEKKKETNGRSKTGKEMQADKGQEKETTPDRPSHPQARGEVFRRGLPLTCGVDPFPSLGLPGGTGGATWIFKNFQTGLLDWTFGLLDWTSGLLDWTFWNFWLPKVDFGVIFV